MSKDVTEIFENYRECARHLRNNYFSTRQSKSWDTVENFNEVNRVLFTKIVLQRLTDNYDAFTSRAVEDNRILIVPDAERMPLMISREKKGGYWDYPIQYLERGDAKIAFKEYHCCPA